MLKMVFRPDDRFLKVTRYGCYSDCRVVDPYFCNDFEIKPLF